MKKQTNQIRISEIFHSLQGESTTSGLPTTFIRLTGCPLRCQYCDTSYAFNGGTNFFINDILKEVEQHQAQYVCITGGEPLAQPAAIELMRSLCDLGYFVSIETSGARDISKIDERVMVVMDLKTPGSEEEDKNFLDNLNYLKPTDQIKFVICDHNDYIWSKNMILSHQLDKKAIILLSPSWNEQNPTQLADWIIKDKLNVRFQIQLHKILWNDEPGH